MNRGFGFSKLELSKGRNFLRQLSLKHLTNQVQLFTSISQMIACENFVDC